MKVVFLDFDGVVNIPSGDFIKDHPIITCGHTAEDELNDTVGMGLVNALCLENNAEIVVSSSWRTAGLEKMRNLLYRSGLDKRIKVQGCTPFGISFSGMRGKEIRAYLKDRKEITDYVILDDDSDFLDEQKPHLVKCDGYYGFKLHEFLEARKIFGQQN